MIRETILNWKTDDIKFLERLIEEVGIFTNEIVEEVRDNYDPFDINSYIAVVLNYKIDKIKEMLIEWINNNEYIFDK